MKVRPSVKPMCEKCKIIRREGPRHGHLRESQAQAETGLSEIGGALTNGKNCRY